MNKLKKALVSIGLAATILTGGAVADLATSHNTSQAEAYTDRWWHYQYNCMPYPSGAFQWRDFNWLEELFGEHDRYVWKFNFYRYC